MGDKTHIQWTDATWNPIRGCSRISEGCRNCYAEGVANRFKGEGMPYEGLIASTGQWNGNIKVVDSVMDQPIRWRKPRKIFVNSMSDLFHENLPFEQIDKIFGVMWACLGSDHIFQVLTKRAERMHEYFSADRREQWARWAVNYGGAFEPDAIYDQTAYADGPYPNIWLGVSVEDQKTADERIPLLLDTPAAVRWISAEPLLKPVNLVSAGGLWSDMNGNPVPCPYREVQSGNRKRHLDWVVVGGESGSRARPMHPDWVRSLRDQCVASKVPFFFKQWGEFADQTNDEKKAENNIIITKAGNTFAGYKHGSVVEQVVRGDGARMVKVGKKAAGRLLDGKEWNQYP